MQQAQGRVKPTMQMKAGVAVNDDVGLETEADVMGARAASGITQPTQKTKTFFESDHFACEGGLGRSSATQPIIQGFFTPEVIGGYTDAQAHWTQALGAVTAFDAALNGAGFAHGTNAKTTLLNANATMKANKAKGTLSGEAFEPLHWNAGGAPAVEGPGGANGMDIINYDLTAAAGEIDVRQVKSALTQASAFSTNATAWDANPILANQVELYYQGPMADFNLVNLPIDPVNAAFTRNGNDYYRAAGPGSDMTVNIRSPAGGALINTVLFDVF